MSGKACCYDGPAEPLLQILLKHARLDRSITRYADESKNSSDAKLVHGAEGVEGSAALLLDLHGLHPSLSFSKSMLETCLVSLYGTMHSSWKFSGREQADWRETTKRSFK